MDRTILSQRITSMLRDVKRIENTFYALNMADIQRYPENFETLAMDAALRCEQLACRARHLIYAACNKPKEEYLCVAAAAQGVEIQMQDEIVEIKLPSLLYKRDKWRSMEFLLEPFSATLERWTEENAAPKFEQCTVCFTHVYRRDTQVRMIRDPDNMEVKRYLDVVASFLLLDDNGLLCDIHTTAELGDGNYTRVTVMERRRFPGWLNERIYYLDSP